MASCSLILSHSHPMEKISGNCSSSPILSGSPSRDETGIPTEGRRAVPWLMLPPESSVYKFYRLAEGDVIQDEQQQEPEADSRCLGSVFQGWLAYILRKDCQVFLFNPFSGKSFLLPPLETLPYIKGVIRNSHSGLVESFLDYCYDTHNPHRLSDFVIKKMVLSSSPMDDDCIAVAVYGHLERLAFCRRLRPGVDADSWAWTPLDSPLQQYNTIIFDSRKKLFFGFTEQRVLEAWDLHNDPIKRFLIQGEDFGTGYWPTSSVDEVDLVYKSDYCVERDYLVYDHQSQDLFIVTRYTAAAIDEDGTLILSVDNEDYQFPYKTRTFDVFKLDFIDHDHVELDYLEEGDIGNRAFFIGSNPGFALSTTEFPELRPNSIYFTDDQTWGHSYSKGINYGGHDLGIYDYKERSFLSCYYPVDLDKIHRILPAPIWFVPHIDEEF